MEQTAQTAADQVALNSRFLKACRCEKPTRHPFGLRPS